MRFIFFSDSYANRTIKGSIKIIRLNNNVAQHFILVCFHGSFLKIDFRFLDRVQYTEFNSGSGKQCYISVMERYKTQAQQEWWQNLLFR